jgi:hypothetical protein
MWLRRRVVMGGLGGARLAAVEVVAEGGHDPVDHAEHAADDERHHATDTDQGQIKR